MNETGSEVALLRSSAAPAKIYALRLHVGSKDDEVCPECETDPADVDGLDDEYIGPFTTRSAAEARATRWSEEMAEELDETQTWSWTILEIKPPTGR